MTFSSRAVLSTLLIAASFLVAGCSFSIGGDDEVRVPRDKVESQTAQGLSEARNIDIIPDIACPDDLKAEVGETMTCVLTVEGDTDAYEVAIEVTSVEGENAHWSSEVATTPMEP